jgi:hypothetical protein
MLVLRVALVEHALPRLLRRLWVTLVEDALARLFRLVTLVEDPGAVRVDMVVVVCLPGGLLVRTRGAGVGIGVGVP